jgi:hypothetical protein
MRVKGKKSMDWSEKWYHTLDIAKISETMPFMTETKGTTRKIEFYINADMHDKILEIRTKYPHAFPSASHYMRAILYPGHILLKAVLEHQYGMGKMGSNFYTDMYEPFDAIMEMAHARIAAMRCIKSVFEELILGVISQEEFETFTSDVLNGLPKKSCDAVKEQMREEILCSENIVRINSKHRKRLQRTRDKGEEGVQTKVSRIEDYQDVSKYTKFLDNV